MRGFFNFVNRVDVKTGFEAYASAVQDDNFVGTLTREQAKRTTIGRSTPAACLT